MLVGMDQERVSNVSFAFPLTSLQHLPPSSSPHPPYPQASHSSHFPPLPCETTKLTQELVLC